MPALLSWLFSAISWFSSSFVVRWAAGKVLLISVMTIVLPWVLKDCLQWFWKVGEEYRNQLLIFVTSQISSVINQESFDTTLSITGIAGYIADQIDLVNYFAILVSGYTICWSLKFIGKML